MRADRDDGKTAAFRCLNVARWTLAIVMTVLIVAVIVISLKVLLRPESLRLWVVDGVVYCTPQRATKELTLQLNLRAENPSGRAHMYFYNVTAYLFDGTTPTSNPDEDSIIGFPFSSTDETVRPEMAMDYMTSVEGSDDVMNHTYFELLYTKGGIIRDATLRVNGSLVTEVSSRFNITRPEVIYYCRPLLVGRKQGGEASNSRKNVLCTNSI